MFIRRCNVKDVRKIGMSDQIGNVHSTVLLRRGTNDRRRLGWVLMRSAQSIALQIYEVSFSVSISLDTPLPL